MPFNHILFDEFPTPDHGRGYSAALNVIVVKYQVNMYQRKDDKSPHQQVMDLPDMHITAHEWDYPREHLRQETAAHGRVHAKSREALKQENDEGDEVDKTCKGVVTDGIDLLVGKLQHINFDHIENLFPLASPERYILVPPGKFIAHESPVNPEDEVEEKEECKDKVNEPDRAKPVVEIGLRTINKSKRFADEITCNTEDGYAEGINPVIDANGHFPDVNFTQRDRSVSHGLIGFQVMYIGSIFIIEMHGTCQAGVEGVDGTQHLQRHLGICHRGSDQRLLVS